MCTNAAGNGEAEVEAFIEADIVDVWGRTSVVRSQGEMRNIPVWDVV